MRFVLDITRMPDGPYEGGLTEPDTGRRQDFAGILELLAILEERLGPSADDVPSARREAAPRPDGLAGQGGPP